MTTQLDLHEKVVGEQIVDEGFKIDSLEAFSWYANKIELLMSRIKQHEQMAAKKQESLQRAYHEERDKIQSDFLAETTDYRHSIGFLSKTFGGQALAFATEHLKGVKGKSFNIGRCKFGYRKATDKFTLKDKQKFIQWAYAEGKEALVKIEETVSISEVTKLIKETGTVPDGFEVKKGKDEFFVDVDSTQLFAVTGSRWDTEDANTSGDISEQG